MYACLMVGQIIEQPCLASLVVSKRCQKPILPCAAIFLLIAQQRAHNPTLVQCKTSGEDLELVVVLEP
jgi:hypothetical protein